MKNNLLSSAPPPVRLHIQDFKRVSISLVGCGGTGSHIASGLVALQTVLAERGIALDAVLIDPDVVEPKNVGRQLFAIDDIGKPKATVIADRLNAAFGCKFGANVRALGYDTLFLEQDALNIIIGAVDNAAARREIANAVKRADGKLWWLDCGNANHSGQVGIGNMAEAKAMRYAVALGMTDRLPSPALMFPDLLKAPRVKRAPRSCAEATASGEQALMVNRVVAAYALQLLYAFLVDRDPKWFALSFDLRWGGVKPYPLDVPTLSEVTQLRHDQLVVKGKGK